MLRLMAVCLLSESPNAPVETADNPVSSKEIFLAKLPSYY